MVESGIADPYRYNHYADTRVQPIYTKQALEAAYGEINRTVPAGTGLPGDFEYINSLNTHLWQASRKEISPEEAMRRTAAEWEEITEKYGRENQRKYWHIFKNKFPGEN